MKKGVSILISTYNGKEKLPATLEALSRLKTDRIPGVELILVDNASTDGTSAFTREKWNTLGNPFPLLIMEETKPGKLNAQEKGFAHAAYEYVITCDDDNSFFSDYLEVGYSLMEQNPQIGVLGGQGIAVSTIPIPDWFSEYAYNFACAPQAPQTGEVRPTRNVVYGAGMWVRMKGYQMAKEHGFTFILPSRTGKLLTTGGEDSELCWALRFLGYEVWYADELKFYHHVPADRLTEDYRKRLLEGIQANGPAAKIYLRIAKGEIKEKVRLFWFKELIYTLFSALFLPFNKLTPLNSKELKRIWININYYLMERVNYDKKINIVLDFWQKCETKRVNMSLNNCI
jgi:glycosyltransferase involved in cell wall biosynthesis